MILRLSLRGTESRSNLWTGSEQAKQSGERNEIAMPSARNDRNKRFIMTRKDVSATTQLVIFSL